VQADWTDRRGSFAIFQLRHKTGNLVMPLAFRAPTHRHLTLIAGCLALDMQLAACGGGSGTQPLASTPSPDSVGGTPELSDTGSVLEPLQVMESTRHIISPSFVTIGAAGPSFEQVASGAIVALGDRSLSGEWIVQDIAGDAFHALG